MSMHTPDRIQPSEFLDDVVLPALFERLPAAFPEFDWRRRGHMYEAGPGCADDITTLYGRHDRIVCKASDPYGFASAGGDSCRWIEYICGGASPRGKDFVTAVVRLAEYAGVDPSPITSTTASPEQLSRWKQEHDERVAVAQANRAAAEAEEAERAAEAEEAARRLIQRAAAYTNGGDAAPLKPTHAYFKRRGIAVEKLPAGRLPVQSILAVDDFGLKKTGSRGVGGFLAVVSNAARYPIGCQRYFVGPKGGALSVAVVGDKGVRKAALGRPRGGAVRMGDGFPEGVLVLCEGVETGLAVMQATGWTVWPCLSAEPMTRVEFSPEDLAAITTVVIAGDTDRSDAGREYAELAAERVRTEFGLPAAVALPTPGCCPLLFDSDAQPRDAQGKDCKSVDWLDVLTHAGDDAVNDAMATARSRATATPSAPARGDQADDAGPGDRPPDDDDEQRGGRGGPGPFDYDPELGGYREPSGPVMPKNHHDQALLFLGDQFGPPEGHPEGEPTALRLVNLAGRLYRYERGIYHELGEPSTLRAEVRRWTRPFWQRKHTRERYKRAYYLPHEVSTNEVKSVLEAAADEAMVHTPADDYRTQFWMTNNVGEDGAIDTTTPCWSRRVEHPEREDLPDPDLVLSTRNGLLDLAAWKWRIELQMLPHTPRFFSTSQIDLELPVDDAAAALEDRDLEGLRKYAATLCPRWLAFLGETFGDEEDAEAAPVTIRELHKVIGNLLTTDISHQQGNIVWFHGPPGMGKSVVKEVVVALLGIGNVVSSNMHKLAQGFHFNSWLSKRLAVFADLDQGGKSDKKVNVELFKMIAGGDAMSIDRKHRDEIANYTLRTRILCLVNSMPQMPDATNALGRRSICFDFKNTPAKKDSRLLEALTEPGELAGILLLAVCGLRDLVEDGGFIQPKWSDEPLEILVAQSSGYAEYLEECIEITNNAQLAEDGTEMTGDHAATEDLHHAYLGYCDTIGQRYRPTKSQFMAEFLPVLTQTEWKRRRPAQRNKRKGYWGIKLTPAAQAMVDAVDAQKSREADRTHTYETPGGDLPGMESTKG